jgi:hypothetical protein
MRPASATDRRQRCGIGLEMQKALVAPGFRPSLKVPSLKSPWCASAIPKTLIPTTGYFYGFG